MIARLIAWALAALLLLSAGGARAQSDSDRATARQLTAEAERKLAARDFEGAYALLAKAYSLVPSPMIRVGMGKARASMNQLIEAQQHYIEASKGPPRPNEPASWAAGREAARREADAITPRLGSLEFVIEGPSAPGAVRVVLDGRDEVPKSSLENAIPRAVNPGMHSVRAEAEGFRPFEARVAVAEGEKKKVALRLTPGAAEPAAPVAVPPAGAPLAGAPPPSAEPPADAPSARGSRWTPTTIGGVAAAGVFGAVGVVTGAMSWSRVGTIRKNCEGRTCPDSERDALSSAKSLGTVSTVAFVGAAVGGAVALVGFLSSKPEDKAAAKATGKVTLLVGPSSIGLGGSF
ncbi:MAG TPA: PEGA domain-containing protein [Polyangiaceae bacterium]|nr:PEGA domain-containing protein [Polyangiaceae bacterium]